MGMTVFIIQTQKTEDTNYSEGTTWSRSLWLYSRLHKGSATIQDQSGDPGSQSVDVSRRCCVEGFLRSSLWWLSGISLEPWVNSLLRYYTEGIEMQPSHQGQRMSTTRLSFAKNDCTSLLAPLQLTPGQPHRLLLSPNPPKQACRQGRCSACAFLIPS